jgi:hypothetical protein
MYRPLSPSTSVEDVFHVLSLLPPNALPGGAHAWENVKDAFRRFVRAFAADLRIPENVGEGRGIVTCGGGAKYFPSVYALLRQLRAVG